MIGRSFSTIHPATSGGVFGTSSGYESVNAYELAGRLSTAMTVLIYAASGSIMLVSTGIFWRYENLQYDVYTAK